ARNRRRGSQTTACRPYRLRQNTYTFENTCLGYYSHRADMAENPRDAGRKASLASSPDRNELPSERPGPDRPIARTRSPTASPEGRRQGQRSLAQSNGETRRADLE